MPKIFKRDKTGKLTEIGETFDNNFSIVDLDIVILDKSALLEFLEGEMFPKDDIDPICKLKAIKLGYAFVHDPFVLRMKYGYAEHTAVYLYMYDPRINPEEPFEELLMDKNKWEEFKETVAEQEKIVKKLSDVSSFLREIEDF